MIMDIVVHLSSDNLDLKMQCSSAIFKCASDKVIFHSKIIGNLILKNLFRSLVILSVKLVD